jgi:hypothetical protein
VGFRSQAHDVGVARREELNSLRHRHCVIKRLMECSSLVAGQNKGNLPGTDRIATLMGFGATFRTRAAASLALHCYVDREFTACYI